MGYTNESDFPALPPDGQSLPARPKADKAAIFAALEVMFRPEDVIELRVLHKGKKRTDAGYFNFAHRRVVADEAGQLSNIGAAAYVTLNPVDPQLLGRYNNRMETYAAYTTSDKDIVRRRWLLIDIDPIRPSGTSATDQQLAAAKHKIKAVQAYLSKLGWPDPVVARSGNGYHLLYAIDLPNDDASTALVKGVLAALGDCFDDDQNKVDRSVFNAARICKLYGTVANKGEHTAITPWRISKLLQVPDRVEVTEEQLRRVTAIASVPLLPKPISNIGMNLAGYFDLEAFLQRNELDYKVDQHGDRERFKLATCPFNPEHVNGEAAVLRDPSGKLGFKCMHDSCSNKGWRDVRDLLDGPRAGQPVGVSGAQSLPLGVDSVAESDPWPELQPLIAHVEPQQYPVAVLPDVVRCAVQEVAGFVKAPIPLIAMSAMAALSLATQAHCDVERAEKLSGPTGLYLLAIADSGERKSTCDGFFTKAIREYEAQQQLAAKPILAAYKSARDAWEAKRTGVKDKIKALAKLGQPTNAKELELQNLDKNSPVPPRVPRLIYGDATPEALAYALAKQYPSAGVISSEAGSVFGSHGMGKESVMRNLASLNQLWDGASLPVERRSSESFTVRGARLTISLQAQDATIREFFANTNGLARGTGFLARFLLAWPVSTQGIRAFSEAPANWPALAAFNKRLTAILNRPVPMDADGVLTPTMLNLSPAAKTRWVAFHNEIEIELASGGDFYDVRDVASKTADNAARLAALLHLFDGRIGPIDLDAMESAATIAAWHLHEARRFLGQLVMPSELANPARLESWMLEYCKREKTVKVPTRAIQQFGPSGLREKGAIAAAIKELAELGRARLVMDGRKKLVQLNPELLPAPVAKVAGVAVADSHTTKAGGATVAT